MHSVPVEQTAYPPNVLSQHCSSRRALDLIADKWSVLIIYLLARGTHRHNEMLRLIDGISEKMLTQNLRKLEKSGLVCRTVYPVVPPKVEYALTPLGETLIEPLCVLCQWAEAHLDEVQPFE
jgi:DNA-binding HxlR family transcriptional regulator